MKAAIKGLILLGLFTFASCSSDLSDIKVNEPEEQVDPNNDEPDCKSGCGPF